jgi:crossover junction endonuclease MUS81
MYNVDIIIDSRETQLIKIIENRDLDIYKDNINIKKEQLDNGDIHIKFNETLFIYERKTTNDLISSVKDGRYKEQKQRLLSNFENINYIIEGNDIVSSKNSHNQKMLTSIYYHSIYRDGINVFFTKNADETATFILLLATKISESPDKFKKTMETTTDAYIDTCKIKAKKSSNIDKDTCYLLQLSQIPGISKEIAKNIKDIYPSLNELMKTLNATENKIQLLTKIPNIGKLKAERIIEFLM